LHIALGQFGQHGCGETLAIVSYGNGYYLSRQAAAALEAQGVALRIIDLRWLAPLPLDALDRAIAGCDHVLVVDETRRSGGVAEALMTHLAERGCASFARLTAEDSFIATGPAYAATMPSAQTIEDSALALIGRSD
jgi:2-oxoisovalerate dehydrogenase E1 component